MHWHSCWWALLWALPCKQPVPSDPPAQTPSDDWSTRTVRSPVTGLAFPIGIVQDSAGTTYVANLDNNSITTYAVGTDINDTPASTISGPTTQLSGPAGLSLDQASNLYVTNAGSDLITVFASNAEGNVAPIRRIAGPDSQLDAPVGIMIDTEGNLRVANAGKDSLTGYVPNTNGDVEPLSRIKGPDTALDGPFGIALDPLGNMYVTNSTNSSITIRVSPGGAATMKPKKPKKAKWRLAGRTLKVSAKAEKDVKYRLTAITKDGLSFAVGTCRVTGRLVQCRATLPATGRWTAYLNPRKNAVSGTPTKVLRVKPRRIRHILGSKCSIRRGLRESWIGIGSGSGNEWQQREPATFGRYCRAHRLARGRGVINVWAARGPAVGIGRWGGIRADRDPVCDLGCHAAHGISAPPPTRETRRTETGNTETRRTETGKNHQVTQGGYQSIPAQEASRQAHWRSWARGAR